MTEPLKLKLNWLTRRESCFGVTTVRLQAGCVCVCVCVCVRARVKERGSQERKKESVCVCERERERESRRAMWIGEVPFLVTNETYTARVVESPTIVKLV